MKPRQSYLAPMQRFLGIGLLVVFAFVLVGVYPAQWALRNMARSEMRRGIREGSVKQARVIELSFPTTNGRVNDPQFAWKEADEFMFQGAMYDVVVQMAQGMAHVRLVVQR